MRKWYAAKSAMIKEAAAIVLAIISCTIVVLLWMFATFPTKEAIAIKDQTLIEKVENIDQKVDKVDVKIEKIDERTIDILKEMRKP